jgi:hypothetical protein
MGEYGEWLLISPSSYQGPVFAAHFGALSDGNNRIARISGAGDGNRTNPIGQNKGVTARFSVQLESNGVRRDGRRKFKPLASVRETRINLLQNPREKGGY